MLAVYGGLFSIFLLYISPLRGTKKSKCIFIFLFLFLISAIKSVPANSDLRNYVHLYSICLENSFGDLFHAYLNGTIKDWGFCAIARVFGLAGLSEQIWMVFIAAVFAAACAWFIYKYSDEPYMSLLLVMALYFSFTLSGLRQTMALACLLICFHWIAERKLLPYLLTLVIAALFHSTALIFLPAYWFARMKIGWKQPVIVAVALVFVNVFPDVFRAMIGWLFEDTYLEYYETRTASLSWSGFVIQLFVLAFCVVFRWIYLQNVGKRSTNMKQIDMMLNLMVVGLALQSFSTVVAECFRSSYYYSMFCIAAVPNVIVETTRGKNKLITNALTGMCLLLYMLWSRQYFNFVYFW